MSSDKTYNTIKQMILKEMEQLNLSQFGIKGAPEREISDAFKRYHILSDSSKRGAFADFKAMADGEDVIDPYGDFNSETNENIEVNIREQYYKDWTDKDFETLLYKINPNWRDKSLNEEMEEPLTMSGSDSAKDLRTAITGFAKDNPQLENPKKTIMAIVDEVIK